MVFAAAGLMVGPAGIDIVQLPLRTTLINVLAQATLILTLFVDAAMVDLSRLGREHAAPLRMLGFGLPLMIVIGTGCALALFPTLDWRLALLLGVLLAPHRCGLGPGGHQPSAAAGAGPAGSLQPCASRHMRWSSLFGARMAAIGLSLLGARLRWPTVLFFGWFGPRGLASVINLLLALETNAVVVGDTVFATVVLTVSLSIVLHGVSAQPLAAAYAKWAAATSR